MSQIGTEGTNQTTSQDTKLQSFRLLEKIIATYTKDVMGVFACRFCGRNDIIDTEGIREKIVTDASNIEHADQHQSDHYITESFLSFQHEDENTCNMCSCQEAVSLHAIVHHSTKSTY